MNDNLKNFLKRKTRVQQNYMYGMGKYNIIAQVEDIHLGTVTQITSF